MIKQNIKVALIVIIGLLTFWLIMFNFVKLDVSVKTSIYFNGNASLVAIDSKNSSYIEKHEIRKVKMEYEKQYFNSTITYSSTTDSIDWYLISLPQVIHKSDNPIETTLILDSLNIYEYLIKK